MLQEQCRLKQQIASTENNVKRNERYQVKISSRREKIRVTQNSSRKAKREREKAVEKGKGQDEKQRDVGKIARAFHLSFYFILFLHIYTERGVSQYEISHFGCKTCSIERTIARRERKRDRVIEICARGGKFIFFLYIIERCTTLSHREKKEKTCSLFTALACQKKRKANDVIHERQASGRAVRISGEKNESLTTSLTRRSVVHAEQFSRASDINRQHFDIARLLVYLSRSFLQNKENSFDKTKREKHLYVAIISLKNMFP